MFEEQINSEYNRLIQKIGLEKQISYSELISSISDEKVYADFIIADSRYSNFKILTNLTLEPFFDNNIFENQLLIRKFYNVFVDFSIIKNDYLRDLILQSVELRFNFIIRPFTTISTFLFNESYTLSLIEFENKLNYFINDNLLSNILIKVIDLAKANLSEMGIISKPFFNKIFFEILKSNINSNSVDYVSSLSEAVYSLLDSFNTKNMIKSSLILFYDDLRLFSIVELISNHKDFNNNYEMNDLDDLIKSFYIDQIVEVENYDLDNLDSNSEYLQVESVSNDENNKISENENLISHKIDVNVENETDIVDENDYRNKFQQIFGSLENSF